MDIQDVLKIQTVIGVGYAVNVLFNTNKFLEDHGHPVNAKTVYMARGLGGGVVGLTVLTYLAMGSRDPAFHMAALQCMLAAFCVWGYNSYMKCYRSEEAPEKGDKVDFYICGAMTALLGHCYYVKTH